MKYEEIRLAPGFYLGRNPEHPIVPVVAHVDEFGAVYLPSVLHQGRLALVDAPEQYEPYTRLVPEGSGDFVVDLDTAIANDQGETEEGTIVDAYVLVLAYAKPGELPNYRLTLAAGMPYDRAIGILSIGHRLLDETSFTVGDPS